MADLLPYAIALTFAPIQAFVPRVRSDIRLQFPPHGPRRPPRRSSGAVRKLANVRKKPSCRGTFVAGLGCCYTEAADGRRDRKATGRGAL